MKWTSVSTSPLQKGQKYSTGVASLQSRSLCVHTSSLNLIKMFSVLMCFSSFRYGAKDKEDLKVL